jgi:hypothetical protein
VMIADFRSREQQPLHHNALLNAFAAPQAA